MNTERLHAGLAKTWVSSGSYLIKLLKKMYEHKNDHFRHFFSHQFTCSVNLNREEKPKAWKNIEVFRIGLFLANPAFVFSFLVDFQRPRIARDIVTLVTSVLYSFVDRPENRIIYISIIFFVENLKEFFLSCSCSCFSVSHSNFVSPLLLSYYSFPFFFIISLSIMFLYYFSLTLPYSLFLPIFLRLTDLMCALRFDGCPASYSHWSHE